MIPTTTDNEELLDDDLILTNQPDDEAPAPADEGTDTKPADPDQAFRKALEEQATEEDVTPKGQKLSIIKILGGDFFTAHILRRNILLMVTISIFIIIYIANRYRVEKSMLEIDNLRKELQDMKYKALSTSSRLTERSRQSNVLDMLKANRDSVLKIADRPPYIINVPE